MWGRAEASPWLHGGGCDHTCHPSTWESWTTQLGFRLARPLEKCVCVGSNVIKLEEEWVGVLEALFVLKSEKRVQG